MKLGVEINACCAGRDLSDKLWSTLDITIGVDRGLSAMSWLDHCKRIWLWFVVEIEAHRSVATGSDAGVMPHTRSAT